jgi:hypothetical protein
VPVKYWEILADRLSKAGWSLGWVTAVDSNGRTIRSADGHRGEGKRFVVRAEEKLTAFIELEAAVRKRPVENEEHIDKLQKSARFECSRSPKNRIDIVYWR